MHFLLKIIGYILLYIVGRKWTGRKVKIKVLVKMLVLYFITLPVLQKALSKHPHLLPILETYIDAIMIAVSLLY